MGHARSFSFTDSAVDVALPSSTGLGRIPSISGHTTGPQSNNPALHLFQLRRLQSGWYQTLYQAGNTVLPDAQSFLWKACHDLREWAELLPPTLPSAIQRAFTLELEWSYVYCLMPSARAPVATEYRQSLLFEHAVSFIEHIREAALDPAQPSPFATYYDVMRVYFIGTQLVSLLRDAFDLVVSGRPVMMPQGDGGGVPAPPLPHRFFQLQFEDNLQRSLKAMGFVRETLARFGERWEDAARLLEVFGAVGGEVQGMLERRVVEVQQQQQQQQMHQAQHPQYA
ncbi:fungal specific transcription factor domain-containing protein [Candidatus Bathyarchaeota archaeon]|nr:fungal specific transcription factor domain-containing protein [Candidatus Bathyarchaeota archaeon]